MNQSDPPSALASKSNIHPPPTLSTTFGLLRHGETLWNTQKRIQGFGDSPLTPEGRQQTSIWALTLKRYAWDRIIASDLGRVKETVAILNQELNLPVTFDARLREQNWGKWEGLSLLQIKTMYKEELDRRVALGWHFSAPGGETRLAFKERILTSLNEAAENWPGEKNLVVCHQGVIKAALYHITNRAFLPDEDPLLLHNRFHLISLTGNLFTPIELNIPAAENT